MEQQYKLSIFIQNKKLIQENTKYGKQAQTVTLRDTGIWSIAYNSAKLIAFFNRIKGNIQLTAIHSKNRSKLSIDQLSLVIINRIGLLILTDNLMGIEMWPCRSYGIASLSIPSLIELLRKWRPTGGWDYMNFFLIRFEYFLVITNHIMNIYCVFKCGCNHTSCIQLIRQNTY